MEKKEFNVLDTKEDISLTSCENMDVASTIVKEEMYLEGSSGNNSYEDPHKTFPQLKREEKDQESINNSATPFFFVGIKMEEPDDNESDKCSVNSETNHLIEDYSNNLERNSNLHLQSLKEKLHLKLKNNSCMNIKTESEEEREVDLQTNDVFSGTVDENSVTHSVSGCPMGHSSNEFIRGIECQEYPILQVKEEEEDKKTADQLAVNGNISAFNETQGPSRTVIEEECGSVGIASFSRKISKASFAAAASLRKRTSRTQAEDRRLYICEMCNKSCRSKEALVSHMRIHTGARPYSCHVCEAAFSQSSSLRRHIRIHTGEKPFPCDFCGASFRQSCALREHKKVHTGEKPFSCDACGASFCQNRSLKQHLLTH